MIKKLLKIIGCTAGAVIGLFLFLAVAVYLPPVQGWLKGRAEKGLGKALEARVDIGNVRLAFPLDLSLNGTRAVQGRDTLLEARNLRLCIRVLPLLKSTVDVEGIELRGAKVFTKSFISDTQIRARVGLLKVDQPTRFNWLTQQMDVGTVKLEHSDVRVILTDTAKADTTKSQNKMLIRVAAARIKDTGFYVQMPGDSMRISGQLGAVALLGGSFDLGRSDYGAKSLKIERSSLKYDIPYEKYTRGLDANHLAADSLILWAEGLRYAGGRATVDLKSFALREKSGLTVDLLKGRVTADTAMLRVDGLELRTPASGLKGTVKLPFSALNEGGKGKMDVRIEGRAGRRDVMLLAGSAAKTLGAYWPKGDDLQLKAHAWGNMDRMEADIPEARLGSALRLKARGTALNLLNDRTRVVKLRYDLTGSNLGFLQKQLPQGFALPRGMRLGGIFNMQGNRMSVQTTLQQGGGSAILGGAMNLKAQSYDLNIRLRNFPLHRFMPDYPISPVTADLHAKGHGFNFLHRGTVADVAANIHSLAYDKMPLNNTRIKARLDGTHANAALTADNKMLRGNLNATAQMGGKTLEATLKGRLDDLNLLYMTGDTMNIMTDLDLAGSFGTNGKRIRTSGCLQNINIITPTMGIPADDVDFIFGTERDSTYASLLSGDLTARVHSGKPLQALTYTLGKVADEMKKQIGDARIDREKLKSLLPNVDLFIQSGKRNPISRILHAKGYDYDSLFADLRTDKVTGINGNALMTNFKTGSLLLDRTTAFVFQDTSGIRLKAIVENTSKKNPNKFKASVDGRLRANQFSVQTVFTDAKNVEGMNVGVRGELEKSGDVTFHLFPETSTIAYRKFRVNKDNFLTLHADKYISANVDLLADDQTGLKILTPAGDSLNRYNDITVSLNHVNLGELCSVVPYIPEMDGLLSSDMHIVNERNGEISASGSMEVQDFRYGDYTLGSFASEIVFLPMSKAKHYLNAVLLSDNKEVATFDGIYTSARKDSLDATINLEKFPCKLLNCFMPSDGTAALDGKANGKINIVGPTDKLDFNGDLLPDSMHILSPLYSVNLRVGDKAIPIRHSVINLDSTMLYSTTGDPLKMNGNVDFSNTSNVKLDLALQGKNYELINAPKTRGSLVYGKVFSDIDLTVKGTTDLTIVKGNLNILGNTDVNYLMTNSPLSVDDALSGLVEFVDFSDTTHTDTAKTGLPPTGMFVNLGLKVARTAHMHCELSADGNSYVDATGGGNLKLMMFPSGDMMLNGRFTMDKGEMKYELPFIPLKTFSLKSGSYLRFTGDVYNPMLNITATEKARASVNDNNSATRMVDFNVGVAITQTLNDMGLQFLIEAPEDMNVANELASMSQEERSKAAVTLLATGMYMTTGNRSAFKANNALNSFLQSQIQSIAGNALKTIDLSVGVEGSTTASGNAQTDYTFQFSKHLWNDRVTFIIGGKVSAGGTDTQQNQSFIDNISLEYRLNNSGSHNVKLFYDHDNQDPLEGQYSSAGAGIVLRRKMDRLSELLLFRKKKTEQTPSNK